MKCTTASVLLQHQKDAVQLMTVHKSKGLEQVCLYSHGQGLLTVRINQPLILSRQKGIGFNMLW